MRNFRVSDGISNNIGIVNTAIKGFSWNVAGNLTRSLAGFVINILLARLLGPEPFGIVALALLIVSIGTLIVESGLGAALIQKKEIDKRDVAFVFTLQMSLGILLASLVIGLAPWLARQFSTPMATPVLRIMALMLVFQSFAQVPAALLRRRLDFKRVQIAQVVSFFVGFLGLGIPMALAGMGVWSLVAAQLVQSGLNALILFLFSRHTVAFTLSGPRQILSFGIRVLGANIANWLIQYLDQVVVGRQFGAQNLGYYNRAYFLGSTPATIALTSAQTSLFSAVSRLGPSPEARRLFKSVMIFFAIVFFPTYWFVALESETIIRIIYGQEWLPAASLLKPLSVAFPIFMLMGLQGPVLNGLGMPGTETRIQWITALFAGIVLWIASSISLTAVAWGIVVISVFRLLLLSSAAARALKIAWRESLYSLGVGILLGGVTGLSWLISVKITSASPTSSVWVFSRRFFLTLLVLGVLAWIKRDWLRESMAPGIASISLTGHQTGNYSSSRSCDQ